MEKKYDHQKAERDAQELWQKNNTYSTSNNPGQLYSIDTPPPTVSGSLHIGHIFSYTQTDIIARFKRMSGFSVFYPFGFDDNGLPTEKFVEKQNNINAHSMTRSEFIQLCLKETSEVEKKFEELWRRMGLSVDWSLCYSTIDERSRKISQESFIRLYKDGFIYRHNEPALYCTNCRTTVAQAELDDAQKASSFNDIVFKLPSGENLIVGTTRPELLTSCVALLYNRNDKRYQHLKGQTAIVPVFNYAVPILEDEHVDIEKGTGLVMFCTFGDKTDVLWYKKFKLAYKPSFGLDGKWLESTGPLAGMRAHTARETIIKLLEEQQLLVNKKSITHNVNVHERCKKEIEYLVLPQWFLRILDFKQEFLDLGKAISWYPDFMQSRYTNWVENLSWDWCLSRQRFYGIPFPVWHCQDCNEILLANVDQLPVDPQETKYVGSCKCGSNNIKPDTDVMDTWNTSSLTPYLCKSLYDNKNNVFANDNFMPMSMRPQAHDIIRTWAFYTIVKSWMHNKIIPWQKIVISGHVLSTEKEKISKSQGNAPLAPENLLQVYPADALRYWTAAGSLGYDMAFSDTQLKIGQKLLVKLWNAFLFIKPHIENYQPNQEPPKIYIINKWLLNNISKTYKNYAKHFDDNEFNLALHAIERFFWQDFCDNYIELIKDQFINPQNYTELDIASTRWTLYTVSLRILQMYSPFIPHITESIYQEIYAKNINIDSLHRTKFIVYQQDYNFDSVDSFMHKFLEIISQIRKFKSENQISLKTVIDELNIVSQDVQFINSLKEKEAILKGVTQAQKVVYKIDSAQSEMRCENDKWYATIAVS